jgi:hypothetical protein
MSGSAFVSDRLDIVRLIDAKVTTTRRTATRSKQLAEAARDALHVHEDWIRQHCEQTESDTKRYRRRMKRRERFDNNKRFAVAAVLFLPRLCVRLCRGAVSGLRAVDDAVFSACAAAGTSAYALSRSAAGLASAGIRHTASKSSTVGLACVAALWLMLSSLGRHALALGVALFDAAKSGMFWLGPRASRSSKQVVASVSLGLSRSAAAMGDIGHELGNGAKQQASQLATRLRNRKKVPPRAGAPALDPGSRKRAFLRADDLARDPGSRKSVSPRAEALALDPGSRKSVSPRAEAPAVDQGSRNGVFLRADDLALDPGSRQSISRRPEAPALDPGSRKTVAPRAEAPALDPGRLQQAAFVRLRAEHEQLQARIHAMDRQYERRQVTRGHADAKDWVELRRLALNAQRLFDVQQQQATARAPRRSNGASPPHQEVPRPAVHPLWAGHTIYQAPALAGGAGTRR